MPHLLVIPMACLTVSQQEGSLNESKSSKNSQFRSVIDQTNHRGMEVPLDLLDLILHTTDLRLHATRLNMHTRSNDNPGGARYYPILACFPRWHVRPWHATARLTRLCHANFPVPENNVTSRNTSKIRIFPHFLLQPLLCQWVVSGICSVSEYNLGSTLQ